MHLHSNQSLKGRGGKKTPQHQKGGMAALQLAKGLKNSKKGHSERMSCKFY